MAPRSALHRGARLSWLRLASIGLVGLALIACSQEKASFNPSPTVKVSTPELSTPTEALDSSPAATVGAVSTPPAATPTAEPLLCDGLGHCWLWGAWRNADDSAWVEPTPVPAPSVVRPSIPSAARGTVEGGLLANCGRFYPERVQYWASTAAAYGWDLCAWANIVDCESDGQEWAVNPSSGACGVMQHLPCQYLGDGAGSIALGFQKYSARGWQPWTVGGCFPY